MDNQNTTTKFSCKPLSEVCVIRPPKREAKEKLKSNEEVSFIPMKDLGVRQRSVNATQTKPINDVYGNYTYFSDHDVLLAKITPCFQNGKLGIAHNLKNGIGFGSSEFFVFRCLEKLTPEYLFYFLSQQRFITLGAARMSGSVGQQRVPPEFIQDYPIPVPTLSEQRKIVKILDEALAGIEIATANTKQNIANARELFKSRLEKIFTSQHSHSQQYKIQDICTLINGKAYKKAELLADGKYPVLRVGNFFTNRHWYYSDLELDNTKYCTNGDLLYAWSASFGPRIWDGGKVIFHYHIWRVDIDVALVTKDFLYYWFQWDAKHIKAEQGAGTTMIHVSMKSMNDREINLPNIDKQRLICEQLSTYKENSDKLIHQYNQKLRNLAELKESFLHQAFTPK